MKLPIKPGDPVYFVNDDKTITSDIARSVGVNIYNNIIVICDKPYEVGEDWVFFTEKDARLFAEDRSEDISLYGFMEASKLNTPFKPGKWVYVCRYSRCENNWVWVRYIIEATYFNTEDKVTIIADDEKFTVGVDPVFRTQAGAREWMREHNT